VTDYPAEPSLTLLADAPDTPNDCPMIIDTGALDAPVGPHDDEPHGDGINNRLNWLRAGVLGANDGIVSTAGIVMGAAGATGDRTVILVAGIAGLAAGALSMGAGEYVSVSTQRDSERALLAKERAELEDEPEEELAELAGLYVDKGLSQPLALEVAQELTAHDALAAHAETELGIDPDDLTNPWHAAWASMLAFTLGALLPLLTITLTPAPVRVWATVTAVGVALAMTGWVSARLGYGGAGRAVVRNVGGGVLAMAVTYGVGVLLGTQIG
jgi:vacuolar iron transporter family protein